MQSVDQKQHRSDQPITESRTGRRSPQSLPPRRVPRGPAAGGQREGLRPVTSKQQPSVAAGQSTSHVPVATSSELAQAPDYPSPPPYLSPVAVRCWHHLWTQELDRKLFNERHVVLVASYCVDYAVVVECETSIASLGLLLVDGRGNVRRNPLLAIRDKAQKGMEKTGAKLRIHTVSQWESLAQTLLLEEGDSDGEQLQGKVDQPRPLTIFERVKSALTYCFGLVTPAAARLGLNVGLLRRYIDQHPELQEHIKEIKQAVLDMAEATIHQALSQGNPGITRWYLERKGRERGYGKQKMSVRSAP
jgi:phage terminase small subunit